jgi:beta-galactosidase
MKLKMTRAGILIFIFILSFPPVSGQNFTLRENLFDTGWKFHRGGAQGAENPSFDDSGWSKIDLPHDWSIEDLPGTESPFDINAISQVSGGFTTGGTGWYRKRFNIPGDLNGKEFRIRFDGVYMNSEVWINGQYTGTHPYGYTSFWFDITSNVKPGSENIVAVKVKNEGENSRWYSGSGIYRHVWIDVLPPVHLETWGTYISVSKVTEKEAAIKVGTTIMNESTGNDGIKLITRIVDNKSQLIGYAETSTILRPENKELIVQDIQIKEPSLWSIESPSLYKAESEIYINDTLVDREVTSFGIRTIEWNVSDGFVLNGKPVKLKGGCVHHDNGPLGARAYDRAEERRIELLKASGFNAVRCSHNPPSPAFLDACDRLGMLVIDESFDMWNDAKNPNDYHLWFRDWWQKDIENMVLRDRNHPSVIM